MLKLTVHEDSEHSPDDLNFATLSRLIGRGDCGTVLYLHPVPLEERYPKGPSLVCRVKSAPETP